MQYLAKYHFKYNVFIFNFRRLLLENLRSPVSFSAVKLVLNHVPKTTEKLWKNVAWILVVIYFISLKFPLIYTYTISKSFLSYSE